MNYKKFWIKNLGISEEKIAGGKGDNLNAADIDPEELEKGEAVEREHTPDPQLARDIASDHISEDPTYYDKLSKAGLADELDKEPTQNTTMKNGVLALSIKGTPNGTLPVKGQEMGGEDYNESPVMGNRPEDRASMGGYEPIPVEKGNSEGSISETPKLDGRMESSVGTPDSCGDTDNKMCPLCNMYDCQCDSGNDEPFDAGFVDNDTSKFFDFVDGKLGADFLSGEPTDIEIDLPNDDLESADNPENEDPATELGDEQPEMGNEAPKEDEEEEEEEEVPNTINEELKKRLQKLANIKEAAAAYKVIDGTPHTERPGECDRAKEIQEDPTVLETIKKIEEIVKLHEGDKKLTSSKIGLLNKAKNVLSKWK